MKDNTKEQVSVIIPVYKAEKSLLSCVESVLSQDYGNIEILLVPNGEDEESPSYKLCRKLEGENDGITVLRSDKGVSAARNKGIEKAGGKYILFLDSDDELLPGSISAMVKAMESDDSSLVIAGHEKVMAGKTDEKLPGIEGCISTDSDFEKLKELYEEDLLNMPWSKLFKRECIRELFLQDLSLGEDLCFNLRYITGIGRITVLQKSVYRYIADETGSSLSAGRRTDRIFVCMRLYREANRFFRELFDDNESFYPATRTKVISTFCDELCLLGMAGINKAGEGPDAGRIYDREEYRRQVLSYIRAIRKFARTRKKDIKLKAPDHKLIYAFAMYFPPVVFVLVKLRAYVVRFLKNSKERSTV